MEPTVNLLDTRPSLLGRWTAKASSPALKIAGEQCGYEMLGNSQEVIYDRWEEQWTHAPTLVQIAVVSSWLAARLAWRFPGRLSPAAGTNLAVVSPVLDATVRVARFEVASLLSEEKKL